MTHRDTIQHHIEITRRQIIRQLQEEIMHFQDELGRITTRVDQRDAGGERVCHKIIRRKRQQISSLS